MIKIKIAAESNCIFVAAPNRILDVLHQSMTANIDSINDKVYLEFYDIIKETAFDPKLANSNDLSNMKLLATKVFDVKDFAFDSNNICKAHKVRLPIELSGNVATFEFNATFTRMVPIDQMRQSLVVNKPYLLFVKMIQTVRQCFHHHKDLDLSYLTLDVRNTTRENISCNRRLFFNKEIYPIGFISAMLGDTVKLTFSVKKDEDVTPFAIYEFTLQSGGLTSSEKLQTAQIIPLSTWYANTQTFPVNFTADGNYAKRHKNTIGSALQKLSEVLLANVKLEFEVRTSDYINLSSKPGHLESSTLILKFDRQSVINLLMVQSLQQEAVVKVQMVSEDSRSIR